MDAPRHVVGYIRIVARRKKARGRPAARLAARSPRPRLPTVAQILQASLRQQPLRLHGAEPDLTRRVPRTSGVDLSDLAALTDAGLLEVLATDPDDDAPDGLDAATRRRMTIRLLLQEGPPPLVDLAVTRAEAALGDDFERALLLAMVVGGGDRVAATVWLGGVLLAVARTSMVPHDDVLLAAPFSGPDFVFGREVVAAERAAALTAAIALAGLGDSYSLERVALVAPLVEEAPPSLLQLVQRVRRHGLEPRDLLRELDPIDDGGAVVDPLPRRSFFEFDEATGVVRYRREILGRPLTSRHKKTMMRALLDASCEDEFKGEKELFVHLRAVAADVWTTEFLPGPSSAEGKPRGLAGTYGALDDQLTKNVNALHLRRGLPSIEAVLLRKKKTLGFAHH